MGRPGEFPRPLNPDDEFYRALLPCWIQDDGTVSPSAFYPSKSDQTLSVDWSELSTYEQTCERWVHRGEGRGVASVTAELCRENEQQIHYDPDPENGNPAHSKVFKKPEATISNNRFRKRMARGASLVHVHGTPLPSSPTAIR